jgi:flagellar biosynthesis protein FliP
MFGPDSDISTLGIVKLMIFLYAIKLSDYGWMRAWLLAGFVVAVLPFVMLLLKHFSMVTVEMTFLYSAIDNSFWPTNVLAIIALVFIAFKR